MIDAIESGWCPRTSRSVPFRSVPFRSVPFRSVPFRSTPHAFRPDQFDGTLLMTFQRTMLIFSLNIEVLNDDVAIAQLERGIWLFRIE
jgi:hypothetical protein